VCINSVTSRSPRSCLLTEVLRNDQPPLVSSLPGFFVAMTRRADSAASRVAVPLGTLAVHTRPIFERFVLTREAPGICTPVGTLVIMASPQRVPTSERVVSQTELRSLFRATSARGLTRVEAPFRSSFRRLARQPRNDWFAPWPDYACRNTIAPVAGMTSPKWVPKLTWLTPLVAYHAGSNGMIAKNRSTSLRIPRMRYDLHSQS